eukprot:6209175-Amphidinium_carterae.1
MSTLQNRCLDYFAIRPAGLRGVPKGIPILPHSYEHNLAIGSEGLRGMLEGKPKLLHCCKHYIAISPESL